VENGRDRGGLAVRTEYLTLRAEAPGRFAIALLVVFLSLATPGGAQFGPLGSEFQVNSYTSGLQAYPAIAGAADGDFVVVWQVYGRDGASDGIFGRRFASSGAPLGSEFQVNSYTTYEQAYPSIAADADGDFFVTWQSRWQDGHFDGVFGRRFASSGAPIGTEFRVTSYTYNDQRAAVVASDPEGNFIVVWEESEISGIRAQRFACRGGAIGTEFLVASFTFGFGGATDASVGADAAGNFVVSWERPGQDGSGTGIFAQRYANSGAPVGSEFQVNSYTTGNQNFASLAADPDGDFVVTWESFEQDGSGLGVFAQRYASSGARVGSEFQVNSFTTTHQASYPSIAVSPNGDFVVMWSSDTQDGSDWGVFGQRYSSSGAPVASEFQVHSYTTYNQILPSVAADATGGFVATWQSETQDSADYGIFAQRFGVLDGSPSSTPTATPPINHTPTPTPSIAACPLMPACCVRPDKASLQIRNPVDPIRRKLIWQWKNGTTDKSELGDPVTAATSYALCVYDDDVLELSTVVTADGNWDETARGFKYKNSTGNADGITTVALKAGPGNARIKVKGTGINLPAVALPFSQNTRVTVQLVKNSGSGEECWGSTFTLPNRRNDVEWFNDKEK